MCVAVLVTMHCDGDSPDCYEDIGPDYAFEKIGQVRKEAKIQGWLHSKDDKDLCPECRKMIST